MWIYLVILVFTLLGVFLFDLSKRKQGQKAFYNFILVCVVLISSFAYHIGGDCANYQYFFENITPKLTDLTFSYLSYNDRYQPGFLLFLSLCKSIIPSFYFFKFVYACLLNITVFNFFSRYAKYPFLAVFFYIILEGFYFNFEILREGIALTIFLWAYPFIAEKKWIRFYILSIFAILFHISAVIILFVPFLQLLKVGRLSTFLISIGIVVFTFIFSERLSPALANIMLFDDSIDSRYGQYLTSEQYGESRLSMSMLFSYIVNIFIPIVMLYVLPSEKGENRYYGIVQAMPILIVFGTIIPILFRFTNYFQVFNIIFFIEVFEYFSTLIMRHKKNYIFVTICVLYVGLSFYRNEIRSVDNGFRPIDRYYPYSSIITKQKYPIREAAINYL